MLRAAVGCLILAVTFSSSRASADAQQCVVQNNSGLLLRGDGHLTAARDAYNACVSERDCPEVVRTECEAALKEVKAAVPTLVVAVVDEQKRSLADALLELDGESIRIGGAPIDIDPGPHILSAAHEGKITRSWKIDITERESKSIEVVLKTSELLVVATEPPPGSSDRLGPTKTVALSPTALHALASGGNQPEIAEPSRLLALLLSGVGTAGTASFAYFAVSGDLAKHRLYQCKPDCNPDEVRGVTLDYLVADISAGVALLAFGGAGYLFRSNREEHHATRGVSLELISPPRGSGLGVRWTE